MERPPYQLSCLIDFVLVDEELPAMHLHHLLSLIDVCCKSQREDDVIAWMSVLDPEGYI